MKHVQQFSIILLISVIGELLKTFLPLPVPASVYGLIIMLVALLTGILKLDQVKGAADFLVEIMPVMFVPAGAGTDHSLEYSETDLCTGSHHDVYQHGDRNGRNRKSDTGSDPYGKERN